MSNLLIEAGLFIGLPVVGLLLFHSRKNTRNNLLLAGSLFCIWYTLLINFLHVNTLILAYPYLERTAGITSYLIMPFMYLYTRNTFYPGAFWKKWDWLFLAPAIFYFIDLVPFFLSSNDHKIAVIKGFLIDSRKMFSVSEGWITIAGFHFIFRYLWSLFMIILQIRLIRRNWNFDLYEAKSDNRYLFWFIVGITCLYLPMLFPGIFGVIFEMKWYTLRFIVNDLSIFLLISALYILFSPQILYGFLPVPVTAKLLPGAKGLDPQTNKILTLEKTGNIEIAPKSYGNHDEVAVIIEKIMQFMEQKEPFLNQGYTIHDLSLDIEIPVYQLSPIINNHFNANFSSWLNKYRVNYFIDLYRVPENRELTFDALSLKAGFSNRVTFIKAFKKEKGTTPGAFLKQLANA
jgi:AraC-like DNA-binding protein